MNKLVIVMLLLSPSICLSQESGDGVRVITLGEIEFGCFPHKDAFELLKLRINFPKLQKKVTILESKISNRNLRLIEYEKSTVNLNLQKEVLTNRVNYLNQKIDNMDAWWRNPYIWLGLGAVLGTCTTIAIVYGVRP